VNEQSGTATPRGENVFKANLLRAYGWTATAMRIFFVRHGESEANILKTFSNRGWKHPLTQRGQKQARALAAQLQGRGVTAIYTSPLRRAVESAEILAERLGVPCQIEPALIEYDVGIYEDRSDEEGRGPMRLSNANGHTDNWTRAFPKERAVWISRTGSSRSYAG